MNPRGSLHKLQQKSSPAKDVLARGCLWGEMIRFLERGGFILEGIERVAQFPHEYEGTNQNERA